MWLPPHTASCHIWQQTALDIAVWRRGALSTPRRPSGAMHFFEVCSSAHVSRIPKSFIIIACSLQAL